MLCTTSCAFKYANMRLGTRLRSQCQLGESIRQIISATTPDQGHPKKESLAKQARPPEARARHQIAALTRTKTSAHGAAVTIS